ncbi:tRNA/tmRNA/rRNA uracil-C5-methylase (TrmA/RlmC/RlmD family) [Georgenia soli]|uniref:tRNA/tmRNA/rRNA uracil-C5-methylase (TrmA/RlmC/RlmD family) n=1 Tax=Georgenia soli TaxID=638953 RepID=A0A2A9EGE5_9MICO|nr:TRAM domain-containing protein [Georgenia soli]PFG37913.1 tRNA/tmRNA/rRNA uracil-C5-methylase (TrmA/RlmC/RlmD family) [Georgenia soli]
MTNQPDQLPAPETRTAEEERPVVEVGGPAHGGHCVARLDGRVVFVRHTLPGERVRIAVTDRRSRFWRADAVEVLDPSPDRVPSVWPEAGPGGVGGGELAHVALPAQREWKSQVLAETLRRIGGQEVADDVAAVTGPAGPRVEALPGDDARGGLGTRTRVELTVTPDGLAGMHRFRSHDVLPLSSLPLADPAIGELGLLGADSPWRRTWRPGARVEAVAPSEGDPLVLVDGEPATPARRRGKGPARRSVREVVPSPVGELHYRVAGAGFWQVHRGAPEALVRAVLDAARVQPGQAVLELYSGAGLLSLPLARAVGEEGRVVTLEGSATAVKDARRNLHDHPNVALGTGLVTPATVSEGGQGCDVVVLDPPRAGAGTKVMRAITGLAPGRIVHVACDPAALARDLAAAREAGYVVTALTGLDLFPHTHHFEVVATLERA